MFKLKQFLLFPINFATLSTSDDKKETVEFKLYFRKQKQRTFSGSNQKLLMSKFKNKYFRFPNYCNEVNCSAIHSGPLAVSRKEQSWLCPRCRSQGSWSSVQPLRTSPHWQHWTLSFNPRKQNPASANRAASWSDLSSSSPFVLKVMGIWNKVLKRTIA